LPGAKKRQVDAEKHAGDLLENSQRRKTKGVFQRGGQPSSDEKRHRLRRPVGIGRAIPAPRIVVAILAESIGPRTFLLKFASEIIGVLPQGLLEAYPKNSVVVEGGLGRDVFK